MVKNNKLIYLTLLSFLFVFTAKAGEISCNTAQMQAMDKITGRVSIIEVPVNTEVKFGTFSIVVRDCQTTRPEERPENFAFVDVVDYPLYEDAVNIFKGWMLSSNPAINPVEHPIYDVWLLKCLNQSNDGINKLSDEELAERDNIPSIQQKNDAPELVVQEETIFEEKAEDNKELPENGKSDNVFIVEDEFVEFPISEEDFETLPNEFSF